MADRRSTQTGLEARNAAAAAVVALAEGGRIRITGSAGDLLWESPVLSGAFGPPENGACSLTDPLSGPILVTGTPDRFGVLSSRGEVVWAGSVGDPIDGNQYNIEVDDDFVQGGTFILESLTYEAEAQGN